MPDEYRTPTSDIVAETLNDRYYDAGLTEAIPNGLRIFNQYSGCVTDYLRTEETEWDAHLRIITGEPATYDRANENLTMLKLATAVHFAATPPPAPDYSTHITATVKTGEEYEGITPASQILSTLRNETHNILRTYEYRDLRQRIPTLELTNAGGAVPFQAEGQWDGYDFYFRYRGGTATLKIGTPEDVIGEPLWSASMEYGRYLDGTLDTEEFIYLFCTLARNLNKASYRYRFYDKNVGPDATSTRYRADGTTYQVNEEYTGWGLNPWDARRYAYARNKEYAQMYAEAAVEAAKKGAAEDAPNLFRNVALLDLTTDTIDNRVYPAVRPPFTVLSVPEPTTSFGRDTEDGEG